MARMKSKLNEWYGDYMFHDKRLRDCMNSEIEKHECDKYMTFKLDGN